MFVLNIEPFVLNIEPFFNVCFKGGVHLYTHQFFKIIL